MEKLSAIPDSLYAGESINLERTFNEVDPVDGWSVTYYFTGVGSQYNKQCTVSGSAFVLELVTTDTSSWVVGGYRWAAIGEKTGGVRSVLDEGTIEILADPTAASSGYDYRGHARKTLDAIEAVIERRATHDQMSFTLNNKSLSRMPIAELLLFRDKYRAEIKREDDAIALEQGLKTGNKILTRFVNR